MKFTKDNWITKGVELLNSEGSHAFNIDRMCSRLKITKGSFYHYFDGIDEFTLLVVKHWSKNALKQLDEINSSGKSSEARLNLLTDHFFQQTGKRELGLRNMSLENRSVKSLVDGVTKKRTDSLKQVITGYGVSGQRAQAMARLIHDAWLGILVSGIDNIKDRDQTLSALTDLVMRKV